MTTVLSSTLENGLNCWVTTADDYCSVKVLFAISSFCIFLLLLHVLAIIVNIGWQANQPWTMLSLQQLIFVGSLFHKVVGAARHEQKGAIACGSSILLVTSWRENTSMKMNFKIHFDVLSFQTFFFSFLNICFLCWFYKLNDYCRYQPPLLAKYLLKYSQHRLSRNTIK